MLERKIRYDGSVVEYNCRWLSKNDRQAVLRYEIKEPFSMRAGKGQLHIPPGSHTIAYYWADQPYNVYMWRDKSGRYLGSYFNLVKNTSISEDAVTFEDLIIDVLILPDGSFFILDEDELPQPLELFEDGSVRRALASLTDTIHALIAGLLQDSERRGYTKPLTAGPQKNG